MPNLSSRQKMDRLRDALRSNADPQSAKLALKLDGCGNDWNGRYRCRSPACQRCRWSNVRQQQRVVQDFYRDVTNNELALVSVVLPGVRDVTDIAAVMKKGHEGARKRIDACRASSFGWRDVCLHGWFEIDAVGAFQFPHLPPQRKALLTELAPMTFDQSGPTWLPTFHAVCYLGPLHIAEVRDAFLTQWKLPGQADIRPFDLSKPMVENLASVTAYANKFETETALDGQFVEAWPIDWQANLFTWLDAKPRNTFEFLRFTVGQKAEPVITSSCKSPDVEVEPMPVMTSFSRVPMHINTGGRGALSWY